MDKRLADLGGDDEVVLFDAGDAGDLFDDGRSEAFLDQGRDEWGVLVPEGKAVGEDIEAAIGVEGAELGRDRGRGWTEGLVETMLLGRIG